MPGWPAASVREERAEPGRATLNASVTRGQLVRRVGLGVAAAPADLTPIDMYDFPMAWHDFLQAGWTWHDKFRLLLSDAQRHQLSWALQETAKDTGTRANLLTSAIVARNLRL